MEEEPQNGESAEIKMIKEAYHKAFVYVDRGLTTDESGRKEEAKNYYKQGIGHLLRGLSVSRAEPERAGPGWELAGQMQQQMRGALQNVRARLEILEKGLAPALRGELREAPRLCPEFPPKDTPAASPAPPPVSAPPQPADGGAPAPAARAQTPPCPGPAEAPPAYTPQAAEGHHTVSYGAAPGELAVGAGLCGSRAQPPPLEALGPDADELLLIPSGVQIFFVNPAGEVSAPSYPGYLRIVRFLDGSLDAVLGRPPGLLQVSRARRKRGLRCGSGWS